MNDILKRVRLILHRLNAGYRVFFSISEIENSQTLQWFFGASLLYFVITFQKWVHSTDLSGAPSADAVCWPFFPNCGAFHFLTSLPYGYSQNTFYMVLLSIVVYAAYCMWRKKWARAHACLATLFAWKAVAGFVLSYGLLGMYDYYHLLLTAIFLFFPQKEYFTKAMFVLLYFLSATVKLYPTWVLGTYFTSLQIGLALFPDALTSLFTNIVIFSQVIGCWFLLSSNTTLQRVAFVFFEFFHFYSGVYVGYDYTIIAISTLTILFGPWYQHQKPPLSKKAIAGWSFLGILICIQLYTFAIPGDQKMTLEGYRYGIWMFDANHQCIVTMRSYYTSTTPGFTESSWETSPRSSCGGYTCLTKRALHRDGNSWYVEERYESPKSWSRCSPYTIFSQYQSVCRKGAERVAMQFDHSINGGPFYRIVDEQNICNLSYSAFWHNEWIEEPPEAPVIGSPVKNTYSEFSD